ncbi:MAG: hypothetical protein Ct9H300mP11_18800 [Chloroflexota bacterium]|nr:MAG: hypothetical protein Ct9H300mP11_18800 [Chloroflexota bacterium]
MESEIVSPLVTSWDFPAGSLDLPLVIAHRGDNTNAPENTISAFKKALDLGADGIELDVRLTKDGKLVVIHDRTVDRTTNGTGLGNHHTQEEILRLDAGSWFTSEFAGENPPTLDEYLRHCLQISYQRRDESYHGWHEYDCPPGS